MWVRIPAGTDISDSIVDCFLTIFPEFSIKTYINSEISSSMENQVCEYLSFGGVFDLQVYRHTSVPPTALNIKDVYVVSKSWYG